MKQSVLTIIIIAFCLVFQFEELKANRAGKYGSYQGGCATCHGGTASGATNVTLTGSRTVRTGSTSDFTFNVGHNANNYAGMNVSIRSSTGAVGGTIAAGAGSVANNGELTHANGPKQMTANNAEFPFQWTAPDAHGVYTFYGAGNAVNNNNNDGGDFWNVTGAVNITVQGATLTAPTGATQLCAGSVLSVTWTQTGLGNLRIELSSNNFTTVEVISTSVAASAGSLSYTIPLTQAGSTAYQVRLVELATGNTVSTSSNFTISAGPNVVQQPQSVNVCVGRSLTLTVGATGSGLIYRWRKNGNDVPGGTTATFNLPVTTADDGGTYECIVTGCSVNVTSNSAVVTMDTKPVITLQPLGLELCESDSGSISTAATGSGISYQWYRNGEPVIGAISATLKFNSATIVDEGEYHCRVLGSCSPEANTQKIVVNLLERVAVTSHPTNKNLTSGDSLVLVITSSGDQPKYQWQKNEIDIPGASSATFKKLNVARSDSGVYRCVVTNTCNSVTSNSSTVKVAPSSGGGQLGLSISELDFGSKLLCQTADSLVVGLLVNSGGSPVTINSYSADPPNKIEVIGLTLPLVVPPGGKLDVRVRLTGNIIGSFEGSVQFFSGAGNPSLSLKAMIEEPTRFEADTLVFAQGVTGMKKCNVTLPLDCDALIVNGITISGSGASSYALSSGVTLPYSISKDGTLNVCVETTDTTGANALVTIEGVGYTSTFVLTRRVISSVEEEVVYPLADVRVSPNPMKDELTIRGDGDRMIRVRIVDITGNTVAFVSGNGEIRWDARDLSGTRVSPGLYVAVVEREMNSKFFKILVQ